MESGRKALLMAYCHLDDLSTEESALLERFYLQAVGYLRSAGVTAPDANADPERAAMYDACVDAMVLDAWDKRLVTVDTTLLDNPRFQWMKNQLKMTELPEGAAKAGGAGER